MSWALVQGNTGNFNTSPAASLSQAFGSSVTVGNLVVVLCRHVDVWSPAKFDFGQRYALTRITPQPLESNAD